MVLPPSFSRKMGEIETVEAEKMGWIYLPRGTFYPTLPYRCWYSHVVVKVEIQATYTLPKQSIPCLGKIYFA